MTPRHAWILAAAALLAGCLGGTGTDTENGIRAAHPGSVTMVFRITDSTGAPLRNVEVGVHSTQHEPGSTEASPLLYPDFPRTDSAGRVEVLLRSAGRYTAEGLLNGDLIILDTVRAKAVLGADSTTLKTRPLARLAGRIQLLSGYKVDSGTVFLRGSTRLASVHADGSYDLGNIPAGATGAAPLGIRYAAQPAVTHSVKVVPVPNSITIGPDSSLYIPKDSSLTVGRDSSVLVLSSGSGASGYCLSDSAQNLVAGYSYETTLHNTTLLSQLAGSACAGDVGGLIRVVQTNSKGAPVDTVAEFFISTVVVPPDPHSVETRIPKALPISCLATGGTATYQTTVDPVTGDILVNDLKSGSACAP